MGFGVTGILSERDELHAGTRLVTITKRPGIRRMARSNASSRPAFLGRIVPSGFYGKMLAFTAVFEMLAA